MSEQPPSTGPLSTRSLTRAALLRRSLRHHWRMHFAVALGVAVACAILTGSLVVGDSVRATLRAIAIEKLGRFDAALAVDRFFDVDLASRVSASSSFPGGASLVAVLALEASAVTDRGGERGARASDVSVVGIDGSFVSTGFPAAPEGRAATLPVPERGTAILNETLASEIDAAAGDQILLGLRKETDAPLESFLGESTEAARVLRLQVAAVIPDRGPGLFSLSLGQAAPRLAFVSREELSSAIAREGRANALLAALPEQRRERPDETIDALDRALREALRPGDLGLTVRRLDDVGYLSVESQRMVLSPALLEETEDAAKRLGAPTSPVLTHLAARISLLPEVAGEDGDADDADDADDGEDDQDADRQRQIAYCTVAALDTAAPPPFGPLELVGGEPAPRLRGGQILINEWAAEDLGVNPAEADGHRLEVEYYVSESDEGDEETTTATFTLVGVVALQGVAADRHLTPEFPGLTSEDVDNIGDWDPPFRFDASRVTRRDEEYWDAHRATPKAFVSPEVGRECFQSRFGSATSVRIAPGEEEGTPSLTTLAERLEEELLQRSDAARRLGFFWMPVRSRALEASSGSTEFSSLFIGFSFFLIISAAILVALLFGLQIDRRAREIGTYLAVGLPARSVRGLFLAEAALVAGIGGLLGIAAAFAYGAFLLRALETWWWKAVRVPFFVFEPWPPSLALGYVSTLIVVFAAIYLSARRLGKTSVRSLLAGVPPSRAAIGAESPTARPRKSALVAVSFTVIAVGLSVASLASDFMPLVGTFYGVGTAALVALLAYLSLWLNATSSGERSAKRPSLVGVGARNARRSPARSLLTAALVASASFVLVTVAANHRDPGGDRIEKESGNGGFALVATSEAPLTTPLDTTAGREELGIERLRVNVERDGEEKRVDVDWQGFRSFPFRVRPGDDASCLNLYAPQNPRILGATDEFIDRGGFLFNQHLAGSEWEQENPWRLLHRTFDDGAIPAIGDWSSTKWILKVGLGDDLVIRDDRGEEMTLRLVATLSGSFFQSELIVGDEPFRTHFPGREGFQRFLFELPRTDGVIDPFTREAIEKGLERELEPFGVDVVDTPSLIRAFLAVENTYLSTFQLLGGLGLLLGTVGLAVVLVRGVVERRGELALLRAVGFPAKKLASLVLAENVLLLGAGIASGTSAAVLAVAPRLNDPSASIPWGSLVSLLAVVFVVGLLSGAIAVAMSVRAPALGVLRQEA